MKFCTIGMTAHIILIFMWTLAKWYVVGLYFYFTKIAYDWKWIDNTYSRQKQKKIMKRTFMNYIIFGIMKVHPNITTTNYSNCLSLLNFFIGWKCRQTRIWFKKLKIRRFIEPVSGRAFRSIVVYFVTTWNYSIETNRFIHSYNIWTLSSFVFV